MTVSISTWNLLLKSMVNSPDNQLMLFGKEQEEECKIPVKPNVITRTSHYGNKQSQANLLGPLLGEKAVLDGILNALQ